MHGRTDKLIKISDKILTDDSASSWLSADLTIIDRWKLIII